jgi:hypothetical protein
VDTSGVVMIESRTLNPALALCDVRTFTRGTVSVPCPRTLLSSAATSDTLTPHAMQGGTARRDNEQTFTDGFDQTLRVPSGRTRVAFGVETA